MPPMPSQAVMPPAPAPVPKVPEPVKEPAMDDDFDLGNFDFGGLEDMNDVGDINLDGFDLSTLDNGASEPSGVQPVAQPQPMAQPMAQPQA